MFLDAGGLELRADLLGLVERRIAGPETDPACSALLREAVAKSLPALTEMPPELAAERVQSIGIATYPTGSAVHRAMAEHQMQQQQQQQQQ